MRCAPHGGRRGRCRPRPGEDVGPLHGPPVTIKDAIETRGDPLDGCVRSSSLITCRRTTRLVAPRKEAGAIVFGKHERARAHRVTSRRSTTSRRQQQPLNVESHHRGSSGGSAGAGPPGSPASRSHRHRLGSVRILHCCGVFGLKPSFGVVLQRGYLDPRRRRQDRRRCERIRSDRAAPTTSISSSTSSATQADTLRLAHRTAVVRGAIARRVPDRRVVRRPRVSARRRVPRHARGHRRRALRRRGQARRGTSAGRLRPPDDPVLPPGRGGGVRQRAGRGRRGDGRFASLVVARGGATGRAPRRVGGVVRAV